MCEPNNSIDTSKFQNTIVGECTTESSTDDELANTKISDSNSQDTNTEKPEEPSNYQSDTDETISDEFIDAHTNEISDANDIEKKVSRGSYERSNYETIQEYNHIGNDSDNNQPNDEKTNFRHEKEIDDGNKSWEETDSEEEFIDEDTEDELNTVDEMKRKVGTKMDEQMEIEDHVVNRENENENQSGRMDTHKEKLRECIDGCSEGMETGEINTGNKNEEHKVAMMDTDIKLPLKNECQSKDYYKVSAGSNKGRKYQSDGSAKEIYCICRTSDIDRFMM